MAYVKQTWTNGTSVVDENSLNHIENGIYDNSLDIESIQESIEDIQGTVLYESDNPTANSNITLSDNLSNYTRIKMYGNISDSYYKENFCQEFLLSIQGRFTIPSGRLTSTGVVSYYAIYSNNGTTINYVDIGQIAISTTGNSAKSDGSVKIYKVVGYK